MVIRVPSSGPFGYPPIVNHAAWFNTQLLRLWKPTSMMRSTAWPLRGLLNLVTTPRVSTAWYSLYARKMGWSSHCQFQENPKQRCWSILTHTPCQGLTNYSTKLEKPLQLYRHYQTYHHISTTIWSMPRHTANTYLRSSSSLPPFTNSDSNLIQENVPSSPLRRNTLGG